MSTAAWSLGGTERDIVKLYLSEDAGRLAWRHLPCRRIETGRSTGTAARANECPDKTSGGMVGLHFPAI
jgi:hypothetical protein